MPASHTRTGSRSSLDIMARSAIGLTGLCSRWWPLALASRSSSGEMSPLIRKAGNRATDAFAQAGDGVDAGAPLLQVKIGDDQVRRGAVELREDLAVGRFRSRHGNPSSLRRPAVPSSASASSSITTIEPTAQADRVALASGSARLGRDVPGTRAPAGIDREAGALAWHGRHRDGMIEQPWPGARRSRAQDRAPRRDRRRCRGRSGRTRRRCCAADPPECRCRCHRHRSGGVSPRGRQPTTTPPSAV